MISAIKHIFFFVIAFALGSAISQQNAAHFTYNGNSELSPKTLCQQLTIGSISNPSAEADPLFEHASKSNTDDAHPKTITSCNSLVNILPAINNFSFSAGEQPKNIGFHNAFLSSQIFVFQEPDPPRLG